MASCNVVLKNGTLCGSKVQGELNVCRTHVTSPACPFSLPGGERCGVALKQAYHLVEPDTDFHHPHHDHYKYRMVVVPPEHRRCRECRTPISNLTGFCAKHDALANQVRREEIIAAMESMSDAEILALSKGDQKEITQVLDTIGSLELLKQRAPKLSEINDYREITNPYEELYKLAGQVLKWKDILAAKVAELDSLGYEGKTGEQVAAEAQLFTQALAEARNILVSISKLDVEERMVRVAESQAIMIAETLGRVLDSLGLDESLVLRARSHVSERLRVFGSETRELTS